MAGKVLRFAVASGRVGYVYVAHDGLLDWRVSERAAASPSTAAEQAQKWINALQPDVVVTQKTKISTRKGDKSKRIIHTIARTADHNPVFAVAVERQHGFPSKYEEAAALAEQYPALGPWLPKKRRQQTLLSQVSANCCWWRTRVGPLLPPQIYVLNVQKSVVSRTPETQFVGTQTSNRTSSDRSLNKSN